jgi:hypothetical protein
MPNKGRYKVMRPLGGAVAAGLALAAANSGIALAQYGPVAPVGDAPVPGGYYCVVTSQTAGNGGKSIGPLQLSGGQALFFVGRGTFAGPVQLTVTEPFEQRGLCQGGQGVGDAGFPGYTCVGGVGLLVQRNGSTYRREFRRALRVRLASSLIHRGSVLVQWNGRRFVKVAGQVVRPGVARADLTSGTDVAILNPASHAAQVSEMALRLPAADFLTATRLARPGSRPGAGVLTAAQLRGPGARGSAQTP